MDVNQRHLLLVFLAMIVVVAVFAAALFSFLIGPWLRAFLHGTPVSMLQIVAMRLRGNPVGLVIDAYIALRRAGVEVSCATVENTYVNGRNGIRTSDDLVRSVEKAVPPR